MNHNYKLLVAYDGTNYSGWQVQPNALSIQEIIQSAISIILRQPVTLIGSGRTDAGVHASGQVAHFKTEHEIAELFHFLKSLNGILPKDIRIFTIEKVSLDFHAQRSAVGKTYQYHLTLNDVQNPFQRLYSYHVRHPCDVELLKKAAVLFVGTHDFTSFANEADSGSASKNPVRTINSIELISEPFGVCIEFQGNGFLYKMVRNIVGTMLQVSSGKKPLEVIPMLFAARDRRLAAQAAPAHGLFLTKVVY